MDLGCGYNEFKRYFPNLIGIDIANTDADVFGDWEYFVTDISCPFVYDGTVQVPKIQEFIDKVSSFGVQVILGIVARDEHINTEQQIRLRGKRTLDIALEVYADLTIDKNYLSLETLFLHKQGYLKWLSSVLNFPVDFENASVMKYLDESPNKKYVRYVDSHWLDDTVRLGLSPFAERK